jgi:hypothetical protein
MHYSLLARLMLLWISATRSVPCWPTFQVPFWFHLRDHSSKIPIPWLTIYNTFTYCGSISISPSTQPFPFLTLLLSKMSIPSLIHLNIHFTSLSHSFYIPFLLLPLVILLPIYHCYTGKQWSCTERELLPFEQIV